MCLVSADGDRRGSGLSVQTVWRCSGRIDRSAMTGNTGAAGEMTIDAANFCFATGEIGSVTFLAEGGAARLDELAVEIGRFRIHPAVRVRSRQRRMFPLIVTAGKGHKHRQAHCREDDQKM